MALKDYALTTVQRAADFIGLGVLVEGSTKYTILEALINSVTEFIENYIGYRAKKTAYTEEEYNTEKGQNLLLKNFPIVSGETFTLQRRTSPLNEDEWETVDSQYYHVDEKAGIIEGAGSWAFARTKHGYRVDYTAGFDFDNSATYLGDTEGGDIELAAWMLVSALYGRRKGGAGIIAERIGDYSVSYAAIMMADEDIKAILDGFRRIEAVGVITPVNI